uniref:Uncharacterized protein n=1 Tax=Takifugu rubripes TaxID=31033 RepID=A0A674MR50_TAKRU
MGCNMCVVQKPEEQYRVMFQVSAKELSRLSGDPTLDLQDPFLSSILRRGVRKRAGLANPGGCTQTDISFQHMLALGRSGQHPCGAPPPPDPPPSPPLPPEPFLFSDLWVVQQETWLKVSPHPPMSSLIPPECSPQFPRARLLRPHRLLRCHSPRG